MAIAVAHDGRGDGRSFEAEWDEFLLAEREDYEHRQSERLAKVAPSIGAAMLKNFLFDVDVDSSEPFPILQDPYGRIARLSSHNHSIDDQLQ